MKDLLGLLLMGLFAALAIFRERKTFNAYKTMPVTKQNYENDG